MYLLALVLLTSLAPTLACFCHDPHVVANITQYGDAQCNNVSLVTTDTSPLNECHNNQIYRCTDNTLTIEMYIKHDCTGTPLTYNYELDTCKQKRRLTNVFCNTTDTFVMAPNGTLTIYEEHTLMKIINQVPVSSALSAITITILFFVCITQILFIIGFFVFRISAITTTITILGFNLLILLNIRPFF